MSQEMLSFKAMNGQMGVDEALGIVECVVAVIGNKDSVGDVIIPGAFDRSFKRRKPRVVWGHDWNQPIGKVLEIYEVGPSDPRLPGKVKALGLGAVYARVQFNLKSERGREAFSSVLFFGEEQEWSIGYKTLDAVFDPKMQANILKELELYEVSPVLHGANQLTSTLSIKDAKAAEPDDGDTTSFRASKWQTFDKAWAEKLREEHPEIWRLGGNIKGNAQFAILTKILDENNGSAKTPDQVAALNLREAWVARHHKDFRIAGVVAQIKWLAVGSRGEAYMKRLVNEEIKKRSTKGAMPYPDDDDWSPMWLAGKLSKWFKTSVEVEDMGDDYVVFRKEGDDDFYRSAYHVEDGEAMFGTPRKVGRATLWLPDNEDDAADVSVGEDDDERLLAVEMDDDEKAMIARVEEMEDDEFDESYPDDEEKWIGDVAGAFVRRAITNRRKRKRRMLMGKAAPGTDAINQIANIVGVDAPQERVTGDVLRGYGPRRGNLERLLRYWRPIMKKPGGFRRCRVILADHPELYPLENICAWLHHETTGLWPNEGCHHPTMKNCRKKLKKGKRIVQGSLWSDSDWNSRLASRFGKGADLAMMEDGDEEMGTDWSEEEFKAFEFALKRFVEDEPDFADFLRDDDNWEVEGEDDYDKPMTIPVQPKKMGCGCGCGKSAEDGIEEKAGRVISSRNMEKLRQAHELISEVISVGEPMGDVQTKWEDVFIEGLDTDEAVRILTPVARYHGFSIRVGDDGSVMAKSLKTEEAIGALGNALRSVPRAFRGEVKSLEGRVFADVKPIVDFHGIRYAEKGGDFVLEMDGVGDEAKGALEVALKVLGG